MYPIKTNSLRVTSYFGNRQYYYQGQLVKDFHNGIDLVGGEEIVAIADGTVTGVQKTGVQYGTACYVRIRHDNGWYTLYYHLRSNSIVVNVGQRVTKGQKLGIIGATGKATGIHLHFQIDKGSSSTAINPYDYVFNGKELVPATNNNTGRKSNEELANEVIRGDWGNGQDRKNRLTNAGYDYNAVQSLVNQKLGVGSKPANNSQRTYIVQKGDTLWGIAKRYYGNGNRYPEIARANNIANPNIIHIGQKLIIP